ncbi:MAG TPA: hypothetical protein PLE67_13255 [Tenuifilaceae bacterium]|nr:hypothetical protein [Tenuifilaceae bacterium]HRX68591.1 hypothetical protein [Tenuifilaceae bacterium]
MKKYSFRMLAFSFCILSFGNVTTAQIEQKYPGVSDPNKAYVLNYLKSFDRFINNPDSFFVNGQRNLQYFGNKKAKTVFNFLSPKERMKGNISPDSLYKHIVTYFPDGLGIVYYPEQLELIVKKKNFFSNTYVYKTNVEYSGIRKDGNLVSYSGNQYYYVNSGRGKKSSKISIQRVANDWHYKTKFKRSLYREGLFIEPAIGVNVESYLSTINDTKIETIWVDYGDGWGNYESYTSNELYSFIEEYKLNYSLNLVYMIKPFIGLGVGVSSFNTSTTLGTDYYYYYLPEIMGYIPTIQQSDLYHIIRTKSVSTPAFVRFQFGLPQVSLSFDLGGGMLLKPQFDSYLRGYVDYYGVSVVDGSVVTNDPTLGFMKYTFKDELVYQHRPEKNIPFYFAKANLHLQFSKFYYMRFSFNYTQVLDIDYYESWHMFDMFATGASAKSMDKKPLDVYQAEFGIGLNINEIFFK